MPQELSTEFEDYLNRCCDDEHIEPFFLKIDTTHFLIIDDSDHKLLIND